MLGRLVVVVHTDRADHTRIISARHATQHERRDYEERRDGDVNMRAEYDFSRGVRGKYAARYARGTNIRALDPDVAAAFPDSESVNNALRKTMPKATPKNHRKPSRSKI